MHVYLDLDNTLLATQTFYQEYYKPLLLAYGSTEREIEKSYTFFTNGTLLEGELFTPRRQMEILGWRETDIEEALITIENILREKRSFIFADVRKFLIELKQRGAYFILLTFGHQQFQKQKIIASGISHLFDEVIIIASDKARLLQEEAKKLGETVWFIDDRSEYMRTLQDNGSVLTFHMNRPELGRQCSRNCGARHEIQSLNELLTFSH